MLTEQELNKIFSWLPYREDWTVDRNQIDDNIESFYGGLIKSLIENKSFDTYYSENGGLGNYLEFFCFPNGHHLYKGNAIVVCVSLCAPVAAYGQTTVYKTDNSFGWGKLFSAEKINLVTDSKLKEIEKELKNILEDHKLALLDQELVSKPLPTEIAESLRHENHNDGIQYLHGIFQKTD